MQCGNVKSNRSGVLEEWGGNHEERKMITFSGYNDPKEETHVNAKSLERSNILAKRGY